MTDNQEKLAHFIRTHGPIEAVRVSSARATKWNYWSTVPYQIRLAKSGHPMYHAMGHATQARRSQRLAFQDAKAIEQREGRMHIQAPRGIMDDWYCGVALKRIFDTILFTGPLKFSTQKA